MLIGLPPFYNREQNTQKMFTAIKEKEVTFPSKVTLTDAAKDFILQVNWNLSLSSKKISYLRKIPQRDWEQMVFRKSRNINGLVTLIGIF